VAILLVVENTWGSELSDELAKLELDLAGDGWEVFRFDWGRSSDSTPEALKSEIIAQVAAHPQIDSLFLFGALPVANSGYLGPDGHSARHHETDLFYGDLDEWTDVSPALSGCLPALGDCDGIAGED
tara:strand:- start:13979 stop:14359 length:381 start_codon:yes stop_codon:yes gene_type:complete